MWEWFKEQMGWGDDAPPPVSDRPLFLKSNLFKLRDAGYKFHFSEDKYLTIEMKDEAIFLTDNAVGEDIFEALRTTHFEDADAFFKKFPDIKQRVDQVRESKMSQEEWQAQADQAHNEYLAMREANGDPTITRGFSSNRAIKENAEQNKKAKATASEQKRPKPNATIPKPTVKKEETVSPVIKHKPKATPTVSKDSVAFVKKTMSDSGDGKLMYPLPAEVKQRLERGLDNDPIPLEIYANLLGSESGYKTDATSNTGCRGIGQFTLNTLMEVAYKNKHLLPKKYQDIVDSNIEKKLIKNEKGHLQRTIYQSKRDKNGRKIANFKAIESLAYDAIPGTILAKEYVRTSIEQGRNRFRRLVGSKIKILSGNEHPNSLGKLTDPKKIADTKMRIEALKFHRDRPMTAVDAKTFYLCGPSGGAELLLALANPASHHQRAADYVHPGASNDADKARKTTIAKNNKPVFKKPNGQYRSVIEYYEYMLDRLGQQHLPENLEYGNDMGALDHEDINATPAQDYRNDFKNNTQICRAEFNAQSTANPNLTLKNTV